MLYCSFLLKIDTRRFSRKFELGKICFQVLKNKKIGDFLITYHYVDGIGLVSLKFQSLDTVEMIRIDHCTFILFSQIYFLHFLPPFSFSAINIFLCQDYDMDRTCSFGFYTFFSSGNQRQVLFLSEWEFELS